MPTIKTLIFDFGDVFINLDKEGAMKNALTQFNKDYFDLNMIETNMKYEIGHISSEEFIEFYTSKFLNLSRNNIISAWNFIIKDFPIHRLNFIKELKNKGRFNLILLSNTNEMHIDYIKQEVNFYNEFKDCFDKFYLSHEIGLRKPDASIFEFVLNKNQLKAEECLFIDDTKENTDMAAQLGFNVWNIDENSEDIVDLFFINSKLF